MNAIILNLKSMHSISKPDFIHITKENYTSCLKHKVTKYIPK